MRDSFMFFRSFFDAIECIEDDRERAAAYKALIVYALDGKAEEQSGACRVVMMMAKPILDSGRKRYENGLKGGRPKNQTETKPKPNENQTETKPKPNKNKNKNENENENQNVTVEEERGAGETPGGHTPTAAQVTEYAKSIGYQLDGQTFVDKYEATGWTLGGSPIRDWKAMVRRWKAQDEKRAPEKNEKIHNFDERGDDLDAEVLAKYKQRFAGRV